MKSLPPGVKVVEVGDAEGDGRCLPASAWPCDGGAVHLHRAGAVVQRLLHPVTILAALPLSLGGAFVGCWWWTRAFHASLIGLIMLMGIPPKLHPGGVRHRGPPGLGDGADGIRWWLPVAFRRAADACRKRARPIMTTLASMGAGMPIAVGWGRRFVVPLADGGGRDRGPITSTFLSLLVIPAVFTYVDDLAQWMGRLWRRARGVRGNGGATIRA